MNKSENQTTTENTNSARQEESAQVPRIDGSYILTEIGSVLSLKKGILLTIRELLLRQAENIRAFLREDRFRLVKPVIFVIFCSFLYTILQQTLGFDDGYSQFMEDDNNSTAYKIIFWIQANYGYANIAMALFVAIWIRLFFRRYNYNYWEILIMLLYVFGTMMIIGVLLGIIEIAVGVKTALYTNIIGFIYITWATGQFFNGKKWFNYVKAFFAYLLGSMTATIVALVIGILVDSLKGIN